MISGYITLGLLGIWILWIIISGVRISMQEEKLKRLKNERESISHWN